MDYIRGLISLVNPNRPSLRFVLSAILLIDVSQADDVRLTSDLMGLWILFWPFSGYLRRTFNCGNFTPIMFGVFQCSVEILALAVVRTFLVPILWEQPHSHSFPANQLQMP